MLKHAKLSVLQVCKSTGILHAVENSSWRRNKLLILCYHGIALEDENQWDRSLFMTSDLLRHRLQMLQDHRCNVLPLDEGIRRLYARDLPERSVAITFDDGTYDFYARAWPVLREFGYPVTVYLTTYYSDFNRPVFDVMCSYMLWKARGNGRLEWPEVLPQPAALDEAGRIAAVQAIKDFALERKLSGAEKDTLLADLAGRLGIDYEALCRKRILHIMTPEESRQLASEGVDIQLHTHRHRVWKRKEKFFRELDDNRQRIQAISPVTPRHFCYTGGFYLFEFFGYLEEYGIVSATTCEDGLCDESSRRMQLPRLVDTSTLTDLEFEGWLSGVSALLPSRRYVPASGQLGRED